MKINFLSILSTLAILLNTATNASEDTTGAYITTTPANSSVGNSDGSDEDVSESIESLKLPPRLYSPTPPFTLSKELGEALKYNPTLKILDMSQNELRELEDKTLDLSQNLDLWESMLAVRQNTLQLCQNMAETSHLLITMSQGGVDPGLKNLDLGFDFRNLVRDMLCVSRKLQHRAFSLGCLTELNLNYNRIMSNGAEILAKCLKKNPPLVTLQLACNGVGFYGASYLGDALQVNTNLRTLNLICNGIETEPEYKQDNTVLREWIDRNPYAFVNCIKKNTTLTHLDLSHNFIDDVAKEALLQTAALSNTTLTRLDISHNKAIVIDKNPTKEEIKDALIYTLTLTFGSDEDINKLVQKGP